MTKITSLKGKAIDYVTSDGGYVTLHLVTISTGKGGGKITVDTDRMFDKNGDRFEDDAPAK